MDYDLVDEIIKYESGQANGAETMRLFSHLVKTGQAWTLQGHYGRAARMMIANGLLTPAGEITQYGKTINGIKEVA